MYKEILIGFLTSMLVSLIGGILVYMVLLPNHLTLSLGNIDVNIITKVITLGTLPNLALFQYYIKKIQDYKARGVVLTVIVLAFLFAILKFVI